MSEEEWLKCRDPSLMLAFASEMPPRSPLPDWWFGRNCGRKLRLFAAACVRQIWHLLTDEQCRRAVEVGEQLADGLVREGAAFRALEAIYPVWDAAEEARAAAWEAYYATGGVDQTAFHAALTLENAWQASQAATAPIARSCFESARWVIDRTSECVDEIDLEALKSEQTDLLRDIIGPLPFRPVAIYPPHLLWNDCCVEKLAGGIYQDRDFSRERMSILADAMEDAGCTDPAILHHLRGSALHVRGCWVIDALLGKE